MAPDRAIGRYRRWYGRLLRLYPRTFQERFAEPMTQTFTDLARERSDANRGLHAFAFGTFAETTAGIMRENMTQLMQTRTVLRWVLITAAVLAVPALAMAFNLAIPDPGSGDRGGVKWGPMDFVLAGTMILGAGLLYELGASQGASIAHRIAAGIAAGGALLLTWIDLAVGMMGSGSDNPVSGVYLGVVAVLIIGASLARLRPRSMSIALFVTAAAHAALAIYGIVAGWEPTLMADAFFIGVWVASALLFRQASTESAPAASA